MNNSFRRLRIEESVSNLADFIPPSKGVATCLGNVNRHGHGHVRIEPETQITITVERLNGRVANKDGIN